MSGEDRCTYFGHAFLADITTYSEGFDRTETEIIGKLCTYYLGGQAPALQA